MNLTEERKILARVLREVVGEFRTEQSAKLEAFKADFVERLSALEAEIGALIGRVEKLERSGWDAAGLLGRMQQLENGLAAIEQAGFGAKLDGIESRLAEVEDWSIADAYAGVWKEGDAYERGTLVTDRGSLWICLGDTESRPGANGAWQLCAKRGRDAKNRTRRGEYDHDR